MGDEGDGGSSVEQGHGGRNLSVQYPEFLRDLRDDFLHDSANRRSMPALQNETKFASVPQSGAAVFREGASEKR